MKPQNIKGKVEAGIEGVSHWVESHDYEAFDPGDGSMSFLNAFTLNQHFLKRLLTGGVLRAPFNIRPWIGIKPHVSTKGMGYMAWGYLKRHKVTKDARYAARAVKCLDWLIKHRAPNYAQYCWGNHFSFSTRGGTIPPLAPTIVWSSLIGHAFVEAYEVLGDTQYLEVASSICDWIMLLPREKTKTGACLSYVSYFQSSIHNSNMLGGSLLARVGKLTGQSGALETAKESMLYSCSRQKADGSWFYGEDPKYHWIDNFHTGYNLDCLKRYIDSTGDMSFKGNLDSGFVYFKNTFFEADGRSKYYHDKTYPIDIQCAAQAIDTLTFFADHDPEGLGLAVKVAEWTIDNMQGADGHFYYRDLGWTKNKTPMLHWGQGTMFKALTHLLTKLSEEAHAN